MRVFKLKCICYKDQARSPPSTVISLLFSYKFSLTVPNTLFSNIRLAVITARVKIAKGCFFGICQRRFYCEKGEGKQTKLRRLTRREQR